MTARNRSRLLLLVVLVGIVALLWQCTSAFDRSEDAEAIDVFGPWLGEEADAFAESTEAFTFLTGFEVNYTGSSDFDADLRQRVSGGLGLPDIAFVPQPALFAELATQNILTPLSEETIDAIVDNYPFERELVTALDGEAYLAPYRTNIKSLVWYRPDVFDDNGWEIPETLDELSALTDEIVAGETGIAPWCFTLEAGAATGWPASDWIEDLVLRLAGTEVYTQWSNAEVDFTDDEISDAFQLFDELVLSTGHTFGGAQRILSVPVEDAGLPLFDPEPGCAMYKQATFATGWFPDDVEVGDDVDFFVLPSVDGEPAPLLTGGDGAIQFDDRPEVHRLMAYLMTPDGSEEWAARGGYLSSRDSVDDDYYADSERPFIELLLEGREQGFDASDTFLSGFRDDYLAGLAEFIGETSYLGTLADLETFLETLDDLRSAVRGG